MSRRYCSSKKIFNILKVTEILLSTSKSINFYLDARILVSFVTKKPVGWVCHNRHYNFDIYQILKILNLINRRLSGEPVSRLVRKKAFSDLLFSLSRHTLTPRYDSEILVKVVFNYFFNNSICYNFLDLGTGSGCLIASLLVTYSKSYATAVDASFNSLLQARKNWCYLGLEDRIVGFVGSWCSSIRSYSDVEIIISNPPYISDSKICFLESSTRDYDPFLSLSGGKDGLLHYRLLSIQIKKIIRSNCILILEVGFGQCDLVENIFLVENWSLLVKKSDNNGIIRVMIFSYFY
jgi:release factor glutamine methyltransferase